jgi:6-phosphogluconolactonase
MDSINLKLGSIPRMIRQDKTMSQITVYVGSYSAESGEGIYRFVFDDTTGELSACADSVCAFNPSYLAFHEEKRILYAVLETGEFHGAKGGGVAAYKVGSDGTLHLLNERPTGGLDPCFLAVNQSGSLLAAANYSSGSLSVFPLGQQGEIESCLLVEAHTGSGPDKERQEMPHVHFADFTPDGKYICAVDLGIDAVKFYRFEDNRLDEQESLRITLRPGSGPRHLLFRLGMRYVYIVTELSSEIAVFENTGTRYEERQCISTLPTGFVGSSFAAAVHLSPDGRFLYASNRGHNSIAAFQINGDGTLSLSPEFIRCREAGRAILPLTRVEITCCRRTKKAMSCLF